MSPSPQPARTEALRHVYTSATAGALGVTGFQTVAASREIWQRDEVRRRIEDAVSALRPSDDVDHPIHQVVSIPWPAKEPVDGEERRLVSRSIHAGPTANQRSGNFLVESFLVPQAWLERGADDLDAVVDGLPWSGPGVHREIQGDDLLPPVRLGEIPNPGLRRLEAVAVLPESGRRSVLEAVVGLAERRSALRLVSARTLSSRELETLIRRLPLLLPPACRWVFHPDSAEARPLSLRSLSSGDRAQYPVDLDAAPRSPLATRPKHVGTMVDLDEPRRAAAPLADHLLAYVEWLGRRLEARDWKAIQQLYDTHRGPDIPIHHDLSRFDWRHAPVLPVGLQVPQALQQAAADRHALWQLRERAEIIMQDLESQLSRELDALQQSFQAEVQRVTETHRRQLAEAKQEQKRFLGDLQARHKQQMDELRQTRDAAVKDLGDAQEKAVADLKRLQSQHDQRVDVLKSTGVDRGPHKIRTAGRGSAASGPLDFLLDKPWIPAVLGLLLVAGLAAGWFFLRPQPEEVPNGGLASASSTGADRGRDTSGDTVPDLPEDPALLRADLVERLSRPAAAAALLDDALADTKSRTVGLDLLLEARLNLRGEPLPKGITCALLQAAVGAGADGRCGPGTLAKARDWKPKTGSPPAADASLSRIAPQVFEQELGLAPSCLENAWPRLEVPSGCAVRFDLWRTLADRFGPTVAEKSVLTALLADGSPVNLNAADSRAGLGATLSEQLLKLAHGVYDGTARSQKLADLQGDELKTRLAELEQRIPKPRGDS